MKIEKNNFLIQVKYSDLITGRKDIGRYFFGFGGELYLSAEEITSCDPQIVGNIKSFVKSNRLPLRLHAPTTEIDYSHVRDTVSRTKRLYKKVLRLCKILDIDSVVAHAEFDYGIDFPIDEQLKGAFSLWRVLCDEFRANKIHINIENHYETEPDCLVMLMKRINSPYFGLCIDVGHYNAFSNLDTEKWLGKYPIGSIKEVHLADNEGDDDAHLALGDGNIDLAGFFEIFAKRGEECAFVLEPRNIDETEKSLSFLKKRGFLGE